MRCESKTIERNPRIGIQLYTVRDLTTENAFRNTIRVLAGMGFEGVEFAWNYGGMGPAELGDFLESVGMACCGLHVKLEELRQPTHAIYEYARATGSPYVTTSLGHRRNEWNTLLPQLTEAAEIAASKGLAFTYHNHWQEFEAADGVRAFDNLAAGTDRGLVGLELDIGWVVKAGGDPMSVWRTHGTRIPQIHLRDYDAGRRQVCDVGDGFIDLQAVLDQARELATAWLIYEQDAYPSSPLDSSRVCIERLRACR